jgi:hypothetical protein
MIHTPAELEGERELIGAVAQLSDGLSSLADVVDGNGEHFGERIGLLERRLVSMESVLQEIVAHLGDAQKDDWWRQEGNGDDS